MFGARPVSFRKLMAGFGKGRIAAVVALTVISLLITGAVWGTKKVTVVADGKNVDLRTIYDKPEAILQQAGVRLAANDEFRLSGAQVSNGTVIKVYRAVPVEVIYRDRTEVIITGKPTVGELAGSLGYDPGNSRTEPAEATAITPNMKVRIVELTEKTVTREVPIPPPVVRQPDGMMDRGFEELADEGEDGLKETTVNLKYADGAETSSVTVGERVVIEPKPRIVKVGTRETVHTSRGTMRFKQAYWMEATAYLPTDGSGHGITTSGLAARQGIVAVDPAVIPLGTRVYIPGYGLALAADTGGMITGNRIDLCIEDHETAWNFGRRMVKVYVLAD